MSYALALAFVAAGPSLQNVQDVLDYPTGEGDLVTRLFPIGFSKKGLFAYYFEPADEAVGCYLWELRIVNLVTDKQVERISWDSGGGDCDEAAQDRASVMRKHGAAFEELLRKHGVKINAPAALETGKVTHKGTTYEAVLEPRPAQTTDDGETQTFDVVVRSNGGRKSIGEVTASEFFTWGQKMLGVLLSPVEDRMVVFVRETYRGYEGPPNVVSVKLFGASLRTGFEKAR